MLKVSLYEWKQLMEGLARSLVGPFIQRNSVKGSDCIREYLDGDTVVARMMVCDSNTDKHALECERIFEAEKALLGKVSFIYIPTDEEYEQWDEEENLTNIEVASMRIAEREAQ